MYILIINTIPDDNTVGSSASKSHKHKEKWDDKLDKGAMGTHVHMTWSALELTHPSLMLLPEGCTQTMHLLSSAKAHGLTRGTFSTS